MKTTNLLRAAILAAGILSMSISSREKFDFPEKTPIPGESDDIAPALVPEMSCQNHYVYVYEGVIDLDLQEKNSLPPLLFSIKPLMFVVYYLCITQVH